MFLNNRFADLMKLSVLLRHVEKIKAKDWSSVAMCYSSGGDKNELVTLQNNSRSLHYDSNKGFVHSVQEFYPWFKR